METTIWQKLWIFLGKNWKTTLGGLLILIAGILLKAEIISQEIFGIITTVLVALGFLVAKDADKTGNK